MDTHEARVYRALHKTATEIGFTVHRHYSLDSYVRYMETALHHLREEQAKSEGVDISDVETWDPRKLAESSAAVTMPSWKRIDLAPGGGTADTLAHELAHALNDETDGAHKQDSAVREG